MNNCKEIGVVNATELPVLDYASQADYFLAIADVVAPNQDEMVQTVALVPSEAVVPQGSNVNQFPLEANNSTLTVPAGQVVPAYIQPSGTTNSVMIADSASHCDFLVVSVEENIANGLAMCQSTGVLTFPQGHNYKVIGGQYYLSSTPGQVTTSASETGKKLFKAISRTQLLINM